MLGLERFSGLKSAVATRLHPAALPEDSVLQQPDVVDNALSPFPSEKPIEPLIERVEGFLDQVKETTVFEPAPIQGSFDINKVITPRSVDPHIIRTPRSVLNPDGNGIENDAIYSIHLKGVRLIADRQRSSSA